jgi:hypothetical protein
MRLLIILILAFIYPSIHAQIGIRANYGRSNFSEFEEQAFKFQPNKNNGFLNASASFGIDYWFRLKKRRIEFLPEIAYTSYGKSEVSSTMVYNAMSFDFYFNTQIYLLDLEEDCNCPTFSKQGNTIKKGFFFHIAPMVKYFTFDGRNEMATFNNNKAVTFGIRGGFGLDLGINDFITITPMIAYERSSMANWKNMSLINEDGTPRDISSNYSKISGEVRLGLRFNQGRKRFRP